MSTHENRTATSKHLATEHADVLVKWPRKTLYSPRRVPGYIERSTLCVTLVVSWPPYLRTVLFDIKDHWHLVESVATRSSYETVLGGAPKEFKRSK
jgi:hypothetical protein